MKIYNKKHNNAPADAIYIGRGSYYGNPFEIGVHGNREKVLALYEQYLDKNPRIMEKAKRELSGKNLLCYCKPLPCHGDILIRRINEKVS